MSDPPVLNDELKSLWCSENVVPARSPASLPPFTKYQIPSRGINILLVIPTDNEAKKNVIKEYIEAHAPSNAQVYTEIVPVDSGVGEQPYNSAGAMGAFNRISHALKELQRGQLAALIEKHTIGTVIVGAIENFVQTRDVARPADHAVAVIHNATTGEVATACSRGVTLDPQYVDWAETFGHVHDNPDHGKETVGNLLAARFPGLDPKNWHEVLAGISRYTLLREALENVSTPWMETTSQATQELDYHLA